MFVSKVGFQDEVDEQLADEVNAKSLPPPRKFVSLILDEKEGLVYNKISGQVSGFINVGDINNDLLKLEHEEETPQMAKQVLVLMVRGIFFNLSFPYAHFGTDGIIANLLFSIV